MRTYFNPRSPHGERLGHAAEVLHHGEDFNPRSPHGERRAVFLSVRLPSHISIHAPRTGSDGMIAMQSYPMQISIHAPRTGSDPKRSDTQFEAFVFQSTLPARGATLQGCDLRWCSYFNPRSPHGERPALYVNGRKMSDISIHAPRTGSDEAAQITGMKVFIFQSTLPARGATKNPLEDNGRVLISIHAPRTGSD